MKSATSTHTETIPLADVPKSYLPDAVQLRLDALRSSVDLRLAALEAALADPHQGTALEPLILELARVATEEAQASALKACTEARLDADVRVAQARSAVQKVLEEERVRNLELTRLLEDTRQHGATLDRQLREHRQTARATLDAELRSVREATDAELAKEHARGVDLERRQAALERIVADVEARLAAEQQRADGLRRDVGRADEQIVTARAEQAEAAAARQRAEQALADSRADARRLAENTRATLEAEMRSAQDANDREIAQERARLEDLERRNAALQQVVSDCESRLAAELERSANLRQELDRADHQVAVAQADQADATRAQQCAEAELLDARAALADQARAAADARAELAAERQAVADSRHAASRAAEHLMALGRRESEARESQEQLALSHEQLIAAHQRLNADLGLERQQAEDLRRELAAAQARAEAEIASNDDLRQAAGHSKAMCLQAVESGRATAESLQQAVDEANQRVSDLLQDNARAQAFGEELGASLAVARADAQTARNDADATRVLVERLSKERDDLVAQLDAARKAATTTPAARPKTTPANTVSGTHVPEEAWQAVRLAVRHTFRDLIEVQVNTGTALLCDLSVGGCQIFSPWALKPNQAVKIVLPGDMPVSCAGQIVWAKLEAPAVGRPGGYRAGVQFYDADEPAIEAFIAERTV